MRALFLVSAYLWIVNYCAPSNQQFCNLSFQRMPGTDSIAIKQFPLNARQAVNSFQASCALTSAFLKTYCVLRRKIKASFKMCLKI